MGTGTSSFQSELQRRNQAERERLAQGRSNPLGLSDAGMQASSDPLQLLRNLLDLKSSPQTPALNLFGMKGPPQTPPFPPALNDKSDLNSMTPGYDANQRLSTQQSIGHQLQGSKMSQDALDGMTQVPGIGGAEGLYPILPPGPSMADWEAANSAANSGARSFLQQAMKGGGDVKSQSSSSLGEKVKELMALAPERTYSETRVVPAPPVLPAGSAPYEIPDPGFSKRPDEDRFLPAALSAAIAQGRSEDSREQKNHESRTNAAAALLGVEEASKDRKAEAARDALRFGTPDIRDVLLKDQAEQALFDRITAKLMGAPSDTLEEFGLANRKLELEAPVMTAVQRLKTQLMADPNGAERAEAIMTGDSIEAKRFRGMIEKDPGLKSTVEMLRKKHETSRGKFGRRAVHFLLGTDPDPDPK